MPGTLLRHPRGHHTSERAEPAGDEVGGFGFEGLQHRGAERGFRGFGIVVPGQPRDIAAAAPQRHVNLRVIRPHLLEQGPELFRAAACGQVDASAAQFRVLVVDGAAHPPHRSLGDRHGFGFGFTCHLRPARHQPQPRGVRPAGHRQRLHEMQHAHRAQGSGGLQRIRRRVGRRCGQQIPQMHYAAARRPLVPERVFEQPPKVFRLRRVKTVTAGCVTLEVDAWLDQHTCLRMRFEVVSEGVRGDPPVTQDEPASGFDRPARPVPIRRDGCGKPPQLVDPVTQIRCLRFRRGAGAR